jgi:hypothetical protein
MKDTELRVPRYPTINKSDTVGDVLQDVRLAAIMLMHKWMDILTSPKQDSGVDEDLSAHIQRCMCGYPTLKNYSVGIRNVPQKGRLAFMKNLLLKIGLISDEYQVILTNTDVGIGLVFYIQSKYVALRHSASGLTDSDLTYLMAMTPRDSYDIVNTYYSAFRPWLEEAGMIKTYDVGREERIQRAFKDKINTDLKIDRAPKPT